MSSADDAPADEPPHQFDVDQQAGALVFDALERAGTNAVQHGDLELGAEYFDALFLLQSQAPELADHYVDETIELLDQDADVREEQEAINKAITWAKDWARSNEHPFAEWFRAEVAPDEVDGGGGGDA